MSARLLAAAAAVTYAVLPGPAQAAPGVTGACTAKAYQPTWDSVYYAVGRGSFTCAAPRAWVSVEVCLEALGENGWEGVGCGTETLDNAASVWGEAYGCKWGFYATRTVVTGWSSLGERATASSLPIPGYCTPI